MNKQTEYDSLVQKRKQFQFAEGLYNPSQIDGGIYDQANHLGPWSVWQGNLDATILIIGQDWCDVDCYRQSKGKDDDANPTNRNLAQLLKESLGIDVGSATRPNQTAPIFFTNAILGMKAEGKMSGRVKTSWVRQSSEHFLLPLLHIVNPKIVITLGRIAYQAMAYLHPALPYKRLSELVDSNHPIPLNERMRLYAMFHCGRLGLANRPFERQLEDWRKIQVD